MIYILKKNNLLYITEFPRDKDSPEEQLHPSELLYTFENIIAGKELDLKLRPWLNLESKTKSYKISLLDYIPRVFEVEPVQEELYGKDEESIRDYYLTALKELGISKIKDSQQIIPSAYSCDVVNILEEEYGEDNIEYVTRYLSLPKTSRELLKSIKSRSAGGIKQEIKNNLSDLEEFLPGWAKEELKLFGKTPDNTSESLSPSNPEFKSHHTIIPSQVDISKIFYSEFSLGEDLTGEEIKSRIMKIYKKHNIPGTPKIQDLWNYFEISPSRSRTTGIRGYRIDTRKII